MHDAWPVQRSAGRRRPIAGALLTALLLTALLAAVALGASGDADGGFGSKGIALVPTGNGGRSSAAAAVAQDAKTVVVGQAAQSTGSGTLGRVALTRLNADGGRDTSFGTGGETLTAAGTGESEALGVARAPSGKLVVVGSAVVGGATQIAIARYDADGRPDAGFGTGGLVLTTIGDGGNAVGYGVVVQPDERIVVAGTALDGGANKAFLIRLSSAGAVEGWGGLTAAGDDTDTRARALVRLGDGSYVVAGRAADGTTKLLLARYAEGNGQLTAGWGTVGNGTTLSALGDGGTAIGNAVAVSGDRIVAAGSATDASRTKVFVARFAAGSGQPDAAFGAGGATLTGIGAGGTSEANGVTIAGDGSVLVGGNATDDAGGVSLNQFVAARYRPDGQLDTTFSPASKQPGASLVAAPGQPAYGDALALQGDGKVIVAGRVGDGDGETLAATRFCTTAAQGCTGTGGGSGAGGGGEAPRPPFECGKGRTLGLLEIEGCLREENGRLEASGRLLVNGIVLQPEARSTIVLDPAARRLYVDGPGNAPGQVSARLGSVTIFENLPLDVRLPSLGTDRYAIPELSLSKRGNIFGFPLQGRADLVLVRGGVQLTVQVGLPAPFRGVTGSVSLKADMKDGFRPDGLRVTANEAMIGPLTAKDVLISYDDTDRVWAGQATVFIKPLDYGATGGVLVKDGALKSLVAGISLPVPPPVGPGIFLQSVSFGIGVDPFTVIGGVGLTLGPKTVGNVSAVRVQGNFRLVFPGSPAARVELSTNAFCQLSSCAPGASQDGGEGLQLLTIPVGGFSFAADTDGQISFGGSLGLDVKVASVDASIEGWIDGTRAFNVEGRGTVCVIVVACVGAEAVISSEGLAACGFLDLEVARVAVGFGIRWPFDLSLMGPSCGLSDYRAVKSASAAQAGGPIPVRFPAGEPYGIIRLTGATASPEITISGPGGQIASPAAPSPGVKSGRFLVLKDYKARQTSIVVAKPGSGAWTVTPQDGSSAITSLQQAGPLPTPAVTAKVTGSGYARRLTYTVRRIPGQKVRFAEVGGGVTHVLATTSAARGTVAFTPRDGRKGQRTILATVVQDGLPRSNLKVARYTAPARRLPGRPGSVGARRTGSRLAVTWTPAARASTYLVRVRIGDGRRLLFSATGKRRRILVPSFKRTDTARITVTARSWQLRSGPAAPLSVRAARKTGSRR